MCPLGVRCWRGGESVGGGGGGGGGDGDCKRKIKDGFFFPATRRQIVLREREEERERGKRRKQNGVRVGVPFGSVLAARCTFALQWARGHCLCEFSTSFPEPSFPEPGVKKTRKRAMVVVSLESISVRSRGLHALLSLFVSFSLSPGLFSTPARSSNSNRCSRPKMRPTSSAPCRRWT